MPDHPPLLVFDLDGTLVDSAPDLVAVLNRVISDAGLPAITPRQVGHIVGHGARAMIERAFALHDIRPDTAQIDRLLEAFLVDYEANIAVHTMLFDGAVAAMDRFAGQGWRLAICTNKYERFARKLMLELGYADRFAAITGADTFAWRKPDPRHLTGTVERAGGVPASSVMVGDSITDIRTAKAADIPVVAVDFGYSDVPVSQLGADRVISHFDELWGAVASLGK